MDKLEAMFSELSQSWPLRAGLAIFCFGVCVCLIRSTRLRKWRKVLLQSAKTQDRKSRWVKSLPRDLDLDSEAPLFEILYRHYLGMSRSSAAQVLNLALGGDAISGSSPQNVVRISGSKLTDDEEVSALLSVQMTPESEIPAEALARNAVLNLFSVLKGHKKLRVGLEHAVLDSLGAGGGIAGAKLGGLISLALAPLFLGLWSFVLPVWIVLGALLGSLAGKKMGGRLKSRRYLAATKRLRGVSKDFKKWFLSQFPDLLKERDLDFKNALVKSRELYRQGRNPMLRFLFPDLMTVFFKQSLKRLVQDRSSEQKRIKQVRDRIRGMDPEDFASVLRELDEKTARSHARLFKYFEDYQQALAEMRESKALNLRNLPN